MCFPGLRLGFYFVKPLIHVDVSSSRYDPLFTLLSKFALGPPLCHFFRGTLSSVTERLCHAQISVLCLQLSHVQQTHASFSRPITNCFYSHRSFCAFLVRQ